MKRIIITILASFLFFICTSCSQTKEQLTMNDAIKTDCLQFCDLMPFNGKLHIDSLSESLFIVFDTISRENYYEWDDFDLYDVKGIIISPSYKQRIGYKHLLPQPYCFTRYDDSIQRFPFEENVLLIPFNFEEESMVYTVWKELENDTIEFERVITPVISTKNSCSTIVEKVSLDAVDYLVSKIKGGEGGGFFENLWIGKYDGDAKIHKVHEVTIGYNDGDKKESLEFTLEGNQFKIWKKIADNPEKELIDSFNINTE